MTRADQPEREPSRLQRRLRAELRDHAEREPVDTLAGWALVERRMRREPMRRGLAVAAGVAAVVAVAAVLPRLAPRTAGPPLPPAATGPAGPATVAPSTPPTGAQAPRKPPELRADGLGEFSFGAGPAAVIGRLHSQLGDAPVDTGWVDGGKTPYGTCPGVRARAVTFGRLAVLFSDGPTPFAGAGKQHFIGWVIREGGGSGRRLPFSNEQVTAGEPFERLTAVYGRQARMLERGTRFEVGPRASGGPLDGVPRFHGELRGPRDRAVIATLGAGLRCGTRASPAAAASAGQPARLRRADAAASTASE